MQYLGYPIAILIGYLAGCSNMAHYIARYKRVNLRSQGSGNLGASNATILLGWPAGIAVAIHDIGKAIFAVLLAKYLFSSLTYAGAAAGVACVLGHVFPFYLRFKGGKGFAAYLGMTLALNWKLALVVLALVVLVTLITDYIVVGTVTTIVLVPLYEGLTNSWWIALILSLATLVIAYKHRENFMRIIKGTEIGLRSTARGEKRVKQE